MTSLQKPTPSYTGIPSELLDNVSCHLNVLDRSILRQVSKTERALADKQDYSIDTIEIFTSDSETRITVKEPSGASYDIQPIAHLKFIMTNPKVTIIKVTVSSGQAPFGQNFQNLMAILSQIPLGSVNAQEVEIHSEKYTFRVIDEHGRTSYKPGHKDVSEISEISNFLELFAPEHLSRCSIQSIFSDELWMRIAATEQWKSSNCIKIERELNWKLSIFDGWNGTKLVLKIPELQPEWKKFANELDRVFRYKPIGASFQCHFVICTDPALDIMALRKVDNNLNPTRRLYSFRGSLYFCGFIQPNDGTPAGFEMIGNDEQRYILWAQS